MGSDEADSDEVEERPWRQLLRQPGANVDGPPQLTVRACLAGLAIGTVLCFTNMYFGLQTGWVTMGSIQSALIGFGLFQLPLPGLGQRSAPFGPHENVVVQTVSVAAATLPLAGGFVGIIPALKMLDPPVVLGVREQLLWCAALTYFGIFFAVPLRRQTVLVEKLRFPSGTATAKLIQLLHSNSDSSRELLSYDPDLEEEGADSPAAAPAMGGGGAAPWRVLGWSFAASFGLSALCFVALPTNDPSLHVFTWLGVPSLTAWKWTLRPALSYVGQGMIMGGRPAASLLVGALVGWGYLGPRARASGAAPGKIFDFERGAQGYVLWVAIALMVSEALMTLFLVTIDQVAAAAKAASSSPRSKGGGGASSSSKGHDVEVAPPSQLVPTSWWLAGVVGATALCAAVVSPLFGIPPYQIVVAVALSCLVAVLAVRALGQTDLNPVSAVGKLSQILFTLLAPGHVVTNACRPRAPTPDWQAHRQWIRSSRPRAPQRDRSSPARWPRRARCRRAT